MRSRRRGNGKDVLKKLTPLLIPVPRSDPRYPAFYMRLRYRRERLPPLQRKRLEETGDSLLKELKRLLTG